MTTFQQSFMPISNSLKVLKSHDKSLLIENNAKRQIFTITILKDILQKNNGVHTSLKGDSKLDQTKKNKYVNDVMGKISIETNKRKKHRFNEYKAFDDNQGGAYTFAPLRLYQHNLLTKYCKCMKNSEMPDLNFDCCKYMKVRHNPTVIKITKFKDSVHNILKCSTGILFPMIPLMSITKTPKFRKIFEYNRTPKSCFLVATTWTCEQKCDLLKSTSIPYVVKNVETKIHQKERNYSEPTDVITTNPNLNSATENILIDSLPTPKCDIVKKPRVSKENIKDLMRDAMVKVLHRKIEKAKPKIVDKDSTSSTISIELSFADQEKMLSDISLALSDDLADNESILTRLALYSTKDTIILSGFKENKTWSGTILNNMGIDLFENRFDYEGHRGYIDGIHFKLKSHMRQKKESIAKAVNETFTALSHMYSLKKLLEKKPHTEGKQCEVSHSQQSFMSAILGSRVESENSSSHDESERSTDNESFDKKLTENFRLKFDSQ